MDFLECGICHIPYNEDEQRPRTSLCGHEFCSTCLKALINDGEYICPKCRGKFKVNVVEDLPVVFGLIDVIRAFRANTISLTKEADLRINGATNEDICSIHCKAISHWCSKCQLWICLECFDSHTSLIGCLTDSATKAVGDLKDNHQMSVDQLLTKFEQDTNHISSKIQDHNDKRKEHLEIAEKHGEEVKKLQHMLQLGRDHKEKLEESMKSLNETKSPFAVSDSIKVVTQMKQTLLSWAAKSVGTNTLLETKQGLLKALENINDLYIEKIIKDEKRHSKLSQQDGNIYVHAFQTQDIANRNSGMNFNHLVLEKLIPSDASLVFLELSCGGVVQGKVHVRLVKNLPNTRKYIVQLVIGELGQSLNGTTLQKGGTKLFTANLPFKQITFTPDKNGQCITKKGDLFAIFKEGYFENLFFEFSTSPMNYGKNYVVFGSIEEGMEILQMCYNNESPVTITGCGLVI